MTEGTVAPVVAGVDDGLLRMPVLDRAVQEAKRRGAALLLVHAHGPGSEPAPWQDDAGYRAESYLTRTAPEVRVERICRAANTADLLVGACRPGSLLVLADRRRRLGSDAGHTTERAIDEAPCPVLVIPEHHGPTPPEVVPRRAVVVGVDDGPQSPATLAFALRSAAELGVAVEAVRVVPAVVDGMDPTPDLARARHALEELTSAAGRSFPGVSLTSVVVEDRPARALLDRSAGADQLVVGHRRDGSTSLRGPGSTARSVLLGALCPVAVLGPRALAPASAGDGATPAGDAR